jgi:hypothetical protein
MIGRTLGHFEILEKLGEGGMGIRQARDTHLDSSLRSKSFPLTKWPTPIAAAASLRRRRPPQHSTTPALSPSMTLPSTTASTS